MHNVLTLRLSQSSYAEVVLQQFGKEECKAVCTSVQTKIDCNTLHDSAMNEAINREGIKRLIYFMLCTKPDICFAVGRLLYLKENPTKLLWTIVRQVFPYNAENKSTGMAFSNWTAQYIFPVDVGDLDLGQLQVGRKSTPGHVYTYAGVIFMEIKKQSIDTNSTLEAEKISLGASAQECILLGRVFMFAKEC